MLPASLCLSKAHSSNASATVLAEDFRRYRRDLDVAYSHRLSFLSHRSLQAFRQECEPNFDQLAEARAQLPVTRTMKTEELKAGYEHVFTVTDYYDGPRKGIANYHGQPHFYECIFDEEKVGYLELFRLTALADC